MTPLHIEMMLHYYNRNEDFCNFHGVEMSIINHLIYDLDLLSEATEEPNFGKQHYQITDKGRAYVEQLCKVGLPTKQKWVYEP